MKRCKDCWVFGSSCTLRAAGGGNKIPDSQTFHTFFWNLTGPFLLHSLLWCQEYYKRLMLVYLFRYMIRHMVNKKLNISQIHNEIYKIIITVLHPVDTQQSTQTHTPLSIDLFVSLLPLPWPPSSFPH